jgi:hypothetical protein
VKRRTHSAVDLFDDAGDLVGRSLPWVALLWLTAMPSRFALVFFVRDLMLLGSAASEHGEHLESLAWITLALWLLSLYGRQVYVRACRRALEGDERAGLPGLRVPLRDLAGASAAAICVELLFWITSITLVVPVALLPVAAVAAAAAPRGGPGVRAPLREVARAIGSPATLLMLMVLMLAGLLLATLNLFLLFWIASWLAAPILGVEAPAWQGILVSSNRFFMVLLGAGATLLVEPFWLAAITSHVERVRSASSGEDLRQWLAELRSKELASARVAG